MVQFLFPDHLRFTCKQCAKCCNNLQISLTEKDYKRHIKVNWNKWLKKEEALFPEGKKGERYFCHSKDGGCIFLTANNHCLVHSKKNYDFKALACKLFPFKFISTNEGINVSLKFHCPAVIENNGKLLEKQKKEIKKLFHNYNEENQISVSDTIPFFRDYSVTWNSITEFEQAIITAIHFKELPFIKRVIFVLRYIEEIKQKALTHSSEDIQIDRILESIKNDPLKKAKISSGEKVLFHQFIVYLGAYYKEKEQGAFTNGVLYKLKKIFGGGTLFFENFKRPVKISELKKFSKWIPEGKSLEYIEHFFLTKLLCKDYFGKASFDLPFIEGLSFLMMMYPMIVHIAKLYAISHNEKKPSEQHVKQAIYLTDFTCYASNILQGKGASISQFMLRSQKLIEKIVLHYSL